MEVGLHQLVMASPYPCAGTRPDAIPPAIVPKKNGVSTDEAANVAPANRCSDVRTSTLRKANPEPRITIPSPASPNGMYSVVMMAEKAGGNPVQSTTRQK